MPENRPVPIAFCDGGVYIGGKLVGKLLGVSPLAPLAALNHAFSLEGRLDAAFGSTDPTLESLLPGGG